jgi:hypothetical protein
MYCIIFSLATTCTFRLPLYCVVRAPMSPDTSVQTDYSDSVTVTSFAHPNINVRSRSTYSVPTHLRPLWAMISPMRSVLLAMDVRLLVSEPSSPAMTQMSRRTADACAIFSDSTLFSCGAFAHKTGLLSLYCGWFACPPTHLPTCIYYYL